MSEGTGTGFSTRAIHAGQTVDPSSRAVVLPIHLSSTFLQESPGEVAEFDYSRAGNPTRKALETNIASLEEGHGGAAFSSGMAAISTLVMMHDQGAHFVVSENVYGGTFRVFNQVFARQGYQFTFVDSRNPENVAAAFRDDTKLVFVETPTNPMMHIADLEAISGLAHDKGIRVVVDNTFLSPYFQRPIQLGADFVVHSATKYLGGHSDLIGGLMVTTRAEDTEKVRFLQKSVGAILAPFDCWLLMRGIKTLGVRMQAHERGALAVARFLEAHAKVEKVIFPGLTSHPQHELAKKQATGHGGLLSFILKKGVDPAKFLSSVKVCSLAESLGAVETLISQPATMTHASVPADRRAALGITEALMRISVGLEDVDDLIQDLDQALSRA